MNSKETTCANSVLLFNQVHGKHSHSPVRECLTDTIKFGNLRWWLNNLNNVFIRPNLKFISNNWREDDDNKLAKLWKSVRMRKDSLNEYEKRIRDTPSLWFALDNLAGQNLGCTCELDQECHGDILIKLYDEKFELEKIELEKILHDAYDACDDVVNSHQINIDVREEEEEQKTKEAEEEQKTKEGEEEVNEADNNAEETEDPEEKWMGRFHDLLYYNETDHKMERAERIWFSHFEHLYNFLECTTCDSYNFWLIRIILQSAYTQRLKTKTFHGESTDYKLMRMTKLTQLLEQNRTETGMIMMMNDDDDDCMMDDEHYFNFRNKYI